MTIVEIKSPYTCAARDCVLGTGPLPIRCRCLDRCPHEDRDRLAAGIRWLRTELAFALERANLPTSPAAAAPRGPAQEPQQ